MDGAFATGLPNFTMNQDIATIRWFCSLLFSQETKLFGLRHDHGRDIGGLSLCLAEAILKGLCEGIPDP